MKVALGGHYMVRVGSRKVAVVLESTSDLGGWNATNLDSGRHVHVPAADKIVERIDVEDDPGPAPVAAAPSSVVGVPEVAAAPRPKAVAKKKREVAAAFEAAEAKQKKMSMIDAAYRVLVDAGTEMNTMEMISTMAEKGLWVSPGGKTPHATLYAAILRDIANKHGRFEKVRRGYFKSVDPA